MNAIKFTFDEPTKLAKLQDPQTSHNAAKAVGSFAPSHRYQIMLTLWAHPDGLNFREILDYSNGSLIEPNQVSKRLPEMVRNGWIQVLADAAGVPITRKTRGQTAAAQVYIAVKTKAEIDAEISNR